MSTFDPETGHVIAEACVDTLLEMIRENGGLPYHAAGALPSVIALALQKIMPRANALDDARALDLIQRHAGEMLALLRSPEDEQVPA